MSCKNCFNGCNPVIGDKCVKYTGPDVVQFDIKKGDNLYSVVESMLSSLGDSLTGTNIIPNVSQVELCELVIFHLPDCAECTSVNLNDLLLAFSRAICSISDKLATLDELYVAIDKDINVGCLEVVTNESGIKIILEATISRLCLLITTVSDLTTSVENEYVSVSEINTYIENYLSEESSKVKTKMVPYACVEYYGSLANFDGTGAGVGDWEDVYLCNGNNGTPDKRGRTSVGAIVGMGGGILDAAVDPSDVNNPNYALASKQGSNEVTLNVNQIPSHTHTASVSSSGNHEHFTVTNSQSSTALNSNDTDSIAWRFRDSDFSENYSLRSSSGNEPTLGPTNSSGDHIHAVTNSNTGGNLGHSNIQPSIAAYYIMYIP